MNTTFNSLLTRVDHILASSKSPLQEICDLLKEEVPHYNWVGFYLMNHKEQVLELGPYAGAATEHIKIPFGRGICGQVAAGGQTLVVQDVQAEDNYLACSIETKAEIVLPIYREGQLVAQLDIDSHALNPFTEEDQLFLDTVCAKVARFF